MGEFADHAPWTVKRVVERIFKSLYMQWSNKTCVHDCKPRILEILKERRESVHQGNVSTVLPESLHPVSTPNLSTTSRTHVFLTHTWARDSQGRDNHARVAMVHQALQARGLTTWFDEDRMVGSVRDKMMEGIDNADCVAVFVTEAYRDEVHSKNKRDSCCFEFNCAFDQKGEHKLIPVVMEESMRNNRTWDGIVQATVGDLLYIDISSDKEAVFEAACDRLGAAIRGIIHKA